MTTSIPPFPWVSIELNKKNWNWVSLSPLSPRTRRPAFPRSKKKTAFSLPGISNGLDSPLISLSLYYLRQSVPAETTRPPFNNRREGTARAARSLIGRHHRAFADGNDSLFANPVVCEGDTVFYVVVVVFNLQPEQGSRGASGSEEVSAG